MHPETPPDEANVLEKVETALKEAVHRHPDLDWEYGTRIKRQKCLLGRPSLHGT